MAIKEVTPQEAHELLSTNPEAVYIDVRSEREFANGHPAGAVNIPVAFPDAARGMVLNAEFVKVVEANFPKDKILVIGCQAGPRATTACGLLQQAGYQQISNVLGGFGGLRDATGKTVAPGWASSGLPVSQVSGEGVSYSSLAGKTKA
jgi:rhodanese-related sulfurtransferase